MQEEIFSKLSESGFNLTDLVTIIPKVKSFIPTAKSFLVMAKNWEATNSLKEGQKIVYGIAITEEKCFIYGWIIEQQEGKNVIVDQLFSAEAFDKLEEFLNQFPS